MSPPPPRGRWRSLFVLAFGNMIDTADTGLVNVLFPAIRSALHLNLEALGFLTGISRISRMLFGPLWSLAADRWNRKFLMFLVTGVWGIWSVLAGLAQNQTQLFLLYAMGSIGTVAAEPLTASITADLFESRERGRAFGALRGIGGVGFVVFAPIVGFLSKSPEGWRWAMFLLGGMSILSGLLILAFFRDPGRGATESFATAERIRGKDLKILFTRKSIGLLALSMVLVTSPLLISFAVTYLVDVRGFSNAEGTYIMAVFVVGYIISSVLGGWLGDRAHKKAGFRGRIVLMQTYLVVFAAASFVCLQMAWPHWAFYPLYFAFGLVSALGFPGAVMPIVSAVVPTEARSTAFGFLFSFVHGGVTAGFSILIGWLGQTYGLPTVVFWFTTVPYAVNALFWFVFYKTVPADAASTSGSAN